MNEPLDSRPQRTANRLRLAVAVPVALAGVGILFLAVQLAHHFRVREEPSAHESRADPPTARGTSEQVNASAAALPKARTRPPVAPSVKPGTRAVVSTSATTVESGAPAVAAHVQPKLTTPAAFPIAVGALPARGIVGRVVLRGTPPPEKGIPMDPSCGKIHAGKATTRFFAVAANGGLADVFVSVKELPPGQWEPPAEPVEIRQRGCEYLPYVSAAQAGQIIRVFNDDPLMHNVHPAPVMDGNQERNLAQLPRAAPLDFVFPKPELFLRFKCDVHPWMFAYVSVVEHPFFAVSTVAGEFSLPEPPAGDYTLKFVHRKAGEKLVPVSVRPGKRLVVNVTLDLADPLKHEAVVTEE